ncbi:MAG TPA: hypothetical protein VHR36_01575 [Pyrinomonadaceae bacterium]|jgi:hypothetical protein|nr:hypothetical protein [Pyrinomonadaceae bacterium]
MKKVDRLGWAVGFGLKSYGVRIGVRSNDAAALERACEYLPAGWQATTNPVVDRVYSIMVGGAGSRANLSRFSLLYGDHLRLTRSTELADVFDRFESDLRLFVGEYAPHRVFVHAGVVGWKGKAIVIPGRSYSGKSTLVAALVRAGATYYSDEYAVFDSKGRVHPFAKPLEIRQEGEFKQARVTIGELGGKSGTKPLPVGLVLMTGYKRGATWRPRKLSPGKGVLEMLFNTVSARRSPEKALSTLRHVTRDAEVLKGTRGDTSAVVDALLRRMDRIAERG